MRSRKFGRKVIRFRRWCRGGFAAFASLGKVVSIGCVEGHIADRQLQKSKNLSTVAFTMFSLFVASSMMAAEDDSEVKDVSLNEVVVTAPTQTQIAPAALHLVTTLSAAEIQSIPVENINDLLDYIPGVDVRTRGGNGIQADVSMRGGTFDQILVLLNGVNITDAQTGHASMDIPIDIAQIDRIEVLQGTAITQYGLSAFSGAINIITNSSDTCQLKISSTVGDKGYFTPSFGLKYAVEKWRFSASANYNRSTGYIDNTDYKYGNLFFHTTCNDSTSGSWNLQIGGQIKAFGSNSFYSLNYPDQFESTKTLLGALSWTKKIGAFSLSSTLSYRSHYDRFELFREGVAEFPAWYSGHNYHIVDAASGNIKGVYHSKLGNTTVGVELRNEHIWSNVLGSEVSRQRSVPFAPDSIKFTKEGNRFNVNYFVEQTFFVGHFTAAVGFSGNYNNMFKNNFAGCISAGYQFVQGGNIFVNVSRALRLPTFTDLYYQSATQIANPDLKPEESLTSELGLKWSNYGVHLIFNAYYRIGKNLIDWVKTPEEEKWHSVNHTRIDAMGGELLVGYKHSWWLKNLEVGYAFCHLNKDAGELMSKYALDYLKHKLTITLEHGIYKGLGANWKFTFQQREGTYADREGTVQTYCPVYLLDGQVYWENKLFKIFVEGTNLIGLRYYDYGGIEQPGRWLKAGITINVGL